MSIWTKAENLLKPLKRFAKSERGSVSIMAGIAAIPLLVAGGAAIDFERAVNAKAQLLVSLDSSALYAASLTDTDPAVLTTKAQMYVQQNYNNNGDAVLSNFAITTSGTTVTATAQVKLTNYFMSIVGIPTTTVVASSVADKMGINLEVSLVLDNTGSMNTGNAIGSLITASTKFVDMVMPATQGSFYTKIAAVPYNNSVNAGSMLEANRLRGPYISVPGNKPLSTGTLPTYQYLQFKNGNGGQSTGQITQCVTERLGAQRYTDASVATSVLGRQYDAGENPCTVVSYVPLTTNAATLKATIASMVAANYTAGQVGVAWGWYMLSPNIGIVNPITMPVSVPAGYDKLTTTNLTQKVKKIMVLMSDGEYNSAYADGVISKVLPPTVQPYINYTQNNVNFKAPDNADSFTQAKAQCDAIKATGIELYVITFQLIKTIPDRVSLVTYCATDAAHLIDGDAGGLDAAFTLIANNIKNLRLTN